MCSTVFVTLPLKITNTGPCEATYDWFVLQDAGVATLHPIPQFGTTTIAAGATVQVDIVAAIDPAAPPNSDQTLTAYVYVANPPQPACTDTAHVWVPKFPEINLRYKTFIKCPVISTGTNPAMHDYFAGDGRTFDYESLKFRTYQSGLLTLDPSSLPGLTLVNTIIGTSHAYDSSKIWSPPGSSPPCPEDVIPGQLPDCTEMGSGTLTITSMRITSDPDIFEIHVFISTKGGVGCAIAAPYIDADIEIELRQRCVLGILLPPEYRFSGGHDGYPCHEIYLNESLIYGYDPDTAVPPTNVNSLWGWNDVTIATGYLIWSFIP